jgi:hypothetical protein
MTAGDTIILLDRDGLAVGSLEVEEEKPNAFCGRFVAGCDYARFRPVFEEFSSMVNGMSLAYIDEVEEKITAFGIYGVSGGRKFPIYDLQIFDDRGSVRLAPFQS